MAAVSDKIIFHFLTGHIPHIYNLTSLNTHLQMRINLSLGVCFTVNKQ